MKNILTIISIFILAPFIAFSQSCAEFERVSGTQCDLNVNSPSWSFNQFNEIKRAVMKVYLIKNGSTEGSLCTGTLINQATSEDYLKQYVLLANHCISGKDLGKKVSFMFHYESPNDQTNQTNLTNQGCVLSQSKYSFGNTLIKGYEYFHESFVKEIKSNSWGDYSLVEILSPIPAQYNIYYAGWEPKEPIGGNASNISNAPYLVFHHPRGDIKKVARALTLKFNQNPISQGCNILGGAIDNLIGSIGHLLGKKGKSNVSKICDHASLPDYSVLTWENGSTSRGSSGSSLLNTRGHIMGELSEGSFLCQRTNDDKFGKFSIAYNASEIKNALNPDNKITVNNFGVDGRSRQCYTSNMEVTGQYFPHNHYQSENAIAINVQGNIYNATNAVYVHSGSNYTYNAGGNIILDAGFQTDLNVNFVMNAGSTPCSTSNQREQSEEAQKAELLMTIRSIELPKGNKYFNTSAYVDNSNDLKVEVSPNPTSDQVLVKAYTNESFSVEIQTTAGEHVLNQHEVKDQILIPVYHLVSGVYLVRITTRSKSVVRKLVVQ